jgi:hypothetical protein
MSVNWEKISLEERKQWAAKSIATRKANKEKIKAIREEGFRRVNGLANEIESLEKKLAELQRMEAIQPVSCALTGKALLSEEEIIKTSLPWQKSSGVYFLILGNRVVYVGQSVNVYSRIDEHTRVKSFERYAYVPCSIDMLDKLESLYIHCLRPTLNSTLKDGLTKNAPIPLNLLTKEKNHG